jgi:hypothetical protein
MTMGASNHHDNAFRKEVGTQGVDIDGHDRSSGKAFARCRSRPPTAYGGQPHSIPSHPVVTRHPRPPRQTTDHCQDPRAEKHHIDIARHRHPPPWRPAPPRALHVVTLTTGIAAPNLMLSGLCRRPTPNAAIPTVRTAAPLCRGTHQSRHHHQIPEMPPFSPRHALPPKRTPKLQVTDHHGTGQPPTTTEDDTHAMEPLALTTGEISD